MDKAAVIDSLRTGPVVGQPSRLPGGWAARGRVQVGTLHNESDKWRVLVPAENPLR